MRLKRCREKERMAGKLDRFDPGIIGARGKAPIEPLGDADDEKAGRSLEANLRISADKRRLSGMARKWSRRVRRGCSAGAIANQLTISPFTAKAHIRNILGKLDCRDRTQLITLAYETGFVTPGHQGPATHSGSQPKS
jgi:DNA-binding CsgD family transcriptional regulator